ncbi:MAG TPA: sialidase family protein [Longimicrobium sp.]
MASSPQGAYVAAGPQLEGLQTVRGEVGPDRANLLLYRPGGAALPAPPGDFTFVHPRAAVTPDGALHLVWAEPAMRADWGRARDRRLVPLGSVWHAGWRSGRWSAPERIYRGARIKLEPVLSSALSVDASGGLHVGFPGEDAAGMPRAVHVWHDGRGWHASEIQSRVPPVYVDVLPLRAGRTLMAYVAGQNVGGRDYTNALLVAASSDGGATWSPPRTVGAPEHWPATEPRLVAGRDGAIHLVWLRGAMQGRAALWHASSRDGGRNWEEMRELPLDGLPNGVQAVADARGAVHVVLTSYQQRRPELLHASWVRGGWSRPEPLFAGRMGTQPSLRADAAGRLHLAWVAQVPGTILPARLAPGDTLPWFELDYAVADAGAP